MIGHLTLARHTMPQQLLLVVVQPVVCEERRAARQTSRSDEGDAMESEIWNRNELLQKSDCTNTHHCHRGDAMKCEIWIWNRKEFLQKSNSIIRGVSSPESHVMICVQLSSRLCRQK